MDRVFTGRLRKTYWLCSGFLIVGTLALLIPGWIRRDDFLKESRRLSESRGLIPAVRGRIVAEDGTPLAWSERKIDLYCTLPPGAERDAAVARVRTMLRGAADLNDPEIPIAMDISPEEFRIVTSLPVRRLGLRTLSRTVRRRRDAPAIAETLGRVETGPDGIMRGISGMELEFDDILSGIPGEYRVNLSPGGHWIRSTLRIVVKPVQGADVIAAAERFR